ncbi:N-acetylglucosamine kinase of eukaryotic type [hydrothermal vent metagenome]|uniref:N-acetylglucosamine kinase of eukaryotic type n=1 Tax=hydrothermal vent metagenome TaxID=652676 RepID=A0A3B0TTZ1_9ZZZZ
MGAKRLSRTSVSHYVRGELIPTACFFRSAILRQNDSAHYYLGVDGGGTKCRMRLADQNLTTLGEAVSQTPSNLQVRNGDAAYAAVMELIGPVFAQAGLDMSCAKQTHACFGMAGARMKSARIAFAARKFPFASLKVVDDIDIARAGAHQGKDGAVLIIGTGSAGLGLVNGKRLQIGGWGFLVGDAMSGAILGRKLLRKSLLAFEGIEEKSPLTEAVMEKFDNQPDQMMAWSFDNPEAKKDLLELQASGFSSYQTAPVPARPTDYGSFVPLWFDYYEKGDPVASELMEAELVSIDKHVHWFTKRGAKAIAIVGGLGQRLFPILKGRYGDLLVRAKSEPLSGALILARQAREKD